VTTSYTTIPLRNHDHSGVSVGGQLDHGNAHVAASLTDDDHSSYPIQALQAALEAETDEDTYAAPDMLRDNPGVAKGWCAVNATGGLEAPDHNVASITDTGTGNRIVNWDIDFSTAVYALGWAISLPGVTSGECNQNHFTSRAVGSVIVQHYGGATFDALIDAAFSIIAYGDQ